MKPYTPFVAILFGTLGISLWHTISLKNDCLFISDNHCYTCDNEETFFVGTPEGCSVCLNKQPKYIDWDGKSIWACLSNSYSEDEEIEFQKLPSNDPCPNGSPLRDILGHCYDCQKNESIQISDDSTNMCQGKRYLTRYRNSKKSNICPNHNQIQDPYVCIACKGQWQNEKCVSISLKPMNFCQKNSDCTQNQWCYPFQYPLYSKIGICRPLSQKKWVCSEIEGYTYETAETFCIRQNAHLATLEELENEKEYALPACSDTKIWTIFDEGSIYLDSLKTLFPITKEKESIELGGDNTYALCIQN